MLASMANWGYSRKVEERIILPLPKGGYFSYYKINRNITLLGISGNAFLQFYFWKWKNEVEDERKPGRL